MLCVLAQSWITFLSILACNVGEDVGKCGLRSVKITYVDIVDDAVIFVPIPEILPAVEAEPMCSLVSNIKTEVQK